MPADHPTRWTRERLLYLTAGLIICLVGVALILT